jgi:hypothetical protein
MALVSLPGDLTRQMLAGNMFIGSTAAAGVVIPAYNATGQVFGLWNPAGSGYTLVPVCITIGVATVGTPAVSDFSLSILTNAGGQVATGSPITAFTAATPVNARLGSGKVSQAKFTASAATMTAPAHLMSIGASQESATPGTGIFNIRFPFDGSLAIDPGTYVGVGGSIAIGQTAAVTLVWYEIPYQAV